MTGTMGSASVQTGREVRRLCKVCAGPSEFFGTAAVLGKYRATYLRCDTCGLIETEEPYWLEEAYSNAIADSDIGLIGRNIELARDTRIVLEVLFRGSGTFVDYGGGYGMFVRLMRDAGFDFLRYDKYCPNLFAKGFDVAFEKRSTFDLLTAFEVFEHLVDPLGDLETMLSLSRNVLFTTCLIRKNNPPGLSEWWYYALHTGQHVTLYTREALLVMAKRHNLSLSSNGFVHLFSDHPLPGWLLRCLLEPKVRNVTSMLLPRRRSLREDDYYRLTGQTIA